MMNVGFQKRNLNPNESENPLDFGLAKNCRNPTTFEFGFEIRHIPIRKMLSIPQSSVVTHWTCAEIVSDDYFIFTADERIVKIGQQV